MPLNDETYSRLVNLYQGLDDQQIHQLNAKIILLLSEKVPGSSAIEKIIDQVEPVDKTSNNRKPKKSF